MQISQLSQSRNVYSCLCSYFVPDGFEAHPDHGVEALELSISDVKIF